MNDKICKNCRNKIKCVVSCYTCNMWFPEDKNKGCKECKQGIEQKASPIYICPYCEARLKIGKS